MLADMGICQHDGCELRAECKGFCMKHYMRLKRKGNTSDERKNAAGKRTCSVEGCDKPYLAVGLCSNHWHIQANKARRAKARAERAPHCAHCGVPIPAGRRVRGLTNYCSPRCKRLGRVASGGQAVSAEKHYYSSRYGLTLAERDALLAEASCEICGTTEWPGKDKKPHIDHDHKTGRIRGVLCSNCNIGIGYFKDDPDLLASAIDYLT